MLNQVTVGLGNGLVPEHQITIIWINVELSASWKAHLKDFSEELPLI